MGEDVDSHGRKRGDSYYVGPYYVVKTDGEYVCVLVPITVHSKVNCLWTRCPTFRAVQYTRIQHRGAGGKRNGPASPRIVQPALQVLRTVWCHVVESGRHHLAFRRGAKTAPTHCPRRGRERREEHLGRGVITGQAATCALRQKEAEGHETRALPGSGAGGGTRASRHDSSRWFLHNRLSFIPFAHARAFSAMAASRLHHTNVRAALRHANLQPRSQACVFRGGVLRPLDGADGRENKSAHRTWLRVRGGEVEKCGTGAG